MSLHNLAHHLQSAGRGDDKVLVHMTPAEVGGLQRLAMSQGGSLTINPQTGLPEAGILGAILPTLFGAAFGPAGFIKPLFATQLQTSIAGGLIGTLATGSLSKGIMAGLGAYGGAALGGALETAGGGVAQAAPKITPQAEAAQKAISQGASVTPTGVQPSLAQAAAPGSSAANELAKQSLFAGRGDLVSGRLPEIAGAMSPTDVQKLGIFSTRGDLVGGTTGLASAAQPVADSRLAAMGRGLDRITQSPEKLFEFAKENVYPLSGVASSVYSGMQEDRRMPERRKGEPIQIMEYEYDYPIGVPGGRTSERNYFPNARFTPTGKFYGAAGGGLMSLAEGGSVEEMSRLNAIGANTMYPMANQMSQRYATPAQRPVSENVIRPVGGANIDPYTGEQRFADGGGIDDQLTKLYDDVLKRAPDYEGLQSWKNQFGSTLDPNEIGFFVNKANEELSSRGLPAFSGTWTYNAPGADKAAADQAAAKDAATKTNNVGYIGGGLGTTTGSDEEAEAKTPSPFKDFTFGYDPATGSFAKPGAGAPQGYATPSQVADIYERVLGRVPDIGGLSFYAQQQKMTPQMLEAQLQSSPEYFTNLTKPLVPEITYGPTGLASISGAPAYNAPQYGYPMPVVPNVPAPFTQILTKPSGGTSTGVTGGTTGGTTGGATGTTGVTAGALANNAAAEIEKLYSSYLKRPSDRGGFDYWMSTIGADGIITPDEVNKWKSATDLELKMRGETPDTTTKVDTGAKVDTGVKKDITDTTEDGVYTPVSKTGQPLRAAQLQLKNLYKQVLGRTPDTPGLDYWMKTIGADNIITKAEKEQFRQAALPEIEKMKGQPKPKTVSQLRIEKAKAEAAARRAPKLAAKAAEKQQREAERLARVNAKVAAAMAGRKMAAGGIADLGGYSDGGRLLKGPGDGVSDSIPAVIGNRQPARLADGEFVIPARIVSELGNGSTDAGARKLYAMMDRIQRARKKSVGKERVAVNSRAEKYLPA